VAELEELEHALERGGLAVLRYFMENRTNPRLSEQLALLEQRWSGAPQPSSAAALLQHLRAEVTGTG
jgi:hypothetical protein